ncbi:MAG TPA: hypothetical protein VFB50_05440 [Chloroflexota bacterium]|nr:hypothetical protein [Chloroflexota bacterium]
MAGLNKRPAAYVPAGARLELDRLSKADLMELLWDFGMVATGYADTAPESDVLNIIRGAHQALRCAGWQGNVKLPPPQEDES